MVIKSRHWMETNGLEYFLVGEDEMKLGPLKKHVRMKKPKRVKTATEVRSDPVKAYLAEIGRKGGKVVSEKKLEHLKKARAAKKRN